MKRTYRWKKAMEVHCPACSAVPQHPCVLGEGPLPEPHFARYRAAGVDPPPPPEPKESQR